VSLLVVGLNHRTAPTSVLELAAVSGDDLPKVLDDLVRAVHVAEAVVLSTCNRMEIYAEVDTFHGGVADISDQLARLSGVELADLSGHLYVHHEARAVSHLFSVVCGLDSMLVGESQILGQVRAAFRLAHDAGCVEGTLSALFQAALRVGKRAHSETDIDAAGASIVSVGVQLAASSLTPAAAAADDDADDDGRVPVGDMTGRDEPDGRESAAESGGLALGGRVLAGQALADLAPLAGLRVLLVGAGAVGSLAASTLVRAGAGTLIVANRTPERAMRIAQVHGAQVVGLGELGRELARADLVVTSTGSNGLVIDFDTVADAVAARGGRRLVFVDLALPHDVDPRVRMLTGVTLIDLEALRIALDGQQVADDVDAARELVATEVAGFIDRRRAARVAPTVVALRAQAAAVVRDELDRLRGRLPGLAPHEWDAVERTVGRVVDKVLHAPTVRVQELAAAPGGDSYAEALRELFGLPRDVPAVVSAPDLPDRV
jgi:glutamyl-tRNA reductase